VDGKWARTGKMAASEAGKAGKHSAGQPWWLPRYLVALLGGTLQCRHDHLRIRLCVWSFSSARTFTTNYLHSTRDSLGHCEDRLAASAAVSPAASPLMSGRGWCSWPAALACRMTTRRTPSDYLSCVSRPCHPPPSPYKSCPFGPLWTKLSADFR